MGGGPQFIQQKTSIKAKMLEEFASSRFGFWIVALIMAAVDASFLLKPGKFAFSITRSNQVRLRISSSPFTIRNRELASSFLSFPFCPPSLWLFSSWDLLQPVSLGFSNPSWFSFSRFTASPLQPQRCFGDGGEGLASRIVRY